MVGSGRMAFLACYCLHLPYVEVGTQVHWLWTLDNVKTPQTGVGTVFATILLYLMRNFYAKLILTGVATLFIFFLGMNSAYAATYYGSFTAGSINYTFSYNDSAQSFVASSTSQWCSLKIYYDFNASPNESLNFPPDCYAFSAGYPSSTATDFRFDLFGNNGYTNLISSWHANFDGVQWYFNGVPGSGTLPDTTTRFKTTVPAGGSTVATSSTLSVGFTSYLNVDDWDSVHNDQYYTMKLIPIEPITARPTKIFGPIPVTTFGDFSYSSTTSILYEGRQKVEITLYEALFHIPFTNIGFGWHPLIATTTYFIVGQISSLGTQLLDLNNHLRAAIASSTVNLANSCNPLSSFDMGSCLLGIFVPDQQTIDDDFLLLRTMPPWGYIFRLYDIVTDTASSSMVVLSAVVPPTLPGHGATISLDINHVLDSVLNATSSVFSSGNATSTDTLYEITSPYWEALVYFFFGVYVLGRIIPLFRKFT